MLLDEDLTGAIIGAAITVHRELGPGLLEAVYEECLGHELELQGVRFQRQVSLPLDYRGTRLRSRFRIDLLVGERVVVDVKAVKRLTPVHEAQLLTYLRLARLRVGLLLNFNVVRLRDGISRRVL